MIILNLRIKERNSLSSKFSLDTNFGNTWKVIMQSMTTITCKIFGTTFFFFINVLKCMTLSLFSVQPVCASWRQGSGAERVGLEQSQTGQQGYSGGHRCRRQRHRHQRRLHGH